jgi:hypothetical protein
MQSNKIFWVGMAVIVGGLLSFSTNAMADLVLADGKPTGQWFDPNRSGEGFFVEILKTGSTNQISIAMYTFDENGDPLWVVGNVPIGPDDEVVTVEVFAFDGPMWGPDFDPMDLNTIPFGTITARFPNCDSALFKIATDPDVGLQGGNYSLVRLTSIEGIECTNPPPEPMVTPGTWRGDGVCFNVSADGINLTEVGSECDGNAAFDSNLKGFNDDLNNCDVEAECDGVWRIEGGSFECTGEQGTLSIGTFSSADFASGLAFEPEGGVGDYCFASWTAEPELIEITTQ